MEEKIKQEIYSELLKNPGNWAEDNTHENGNYACHCVACKKQFIGHKRRVICKTCYIQMELDYFK
jgi:hypothetical protein